MKTMKKFVALSVAMVMIIAATGCDKISGLVGNKANDEVEEAMTEYMEQIIAGKYSKAAKLLKDADSSALVAAAEKMDADHADVLAAFVGATEFEIDDVDAKSEESGTVKLIITVPDIAAAAEDATDAEALIDALGDADTVEEEFTVKFVYDDEWLIKDSSKIEGYYVDAVEALSFSAVSEEAALEYINTAMDAITSGDYAAAYELMSDDDMTFDEYVAEEGLTDAQIEMMTAVFTSMTYTSEVAEVGEDYVDVTINITCPDMQAIADVAYDDDFMARIYAYFIWGGDDTTELAQTDMAETFIAAMGSVSDTVNGSMVVRVTADEDGNLDGETVDDSDMFDFDIDGDTLFNTDTNSEEYIMSALEYALESGLITQAEYDEFMGELNGADPDLDFPTDGDPITISDKGDDFWRMYFYDDDDFTNEVTEYHAGDAGIFFDAGTWSYYYDDEVMTIDVYYQGEFATSFTIGTALDYTDRGYASVTTEDGSGLPAGTYVIDITGFDGEHYATVTIIVAE